MVLISISATATPPTVDTPDRTWMSIGLGMAACLMGTAGTLALAAWLATIGPWRPLQFLGQRSLEIFLAHIVAASGTRILLARAGIDAPLAHLVLGTAVGLVAPLALWFMVRRLGIRGVFDLPVALDRRAARGTSRHL